MSWSASRQMRKQAMTARWAGDVGVARSHRRSVANAGMRRTPCRTSLQPRRGPRTSALTATTGHLLLLLRRLLSNRLAAKRSYYRRQNRQSNIKQAIDQVQGELSTAKAKVAVFKQLLRQAGLDPEAILANANVPVAAAAAVNSLPMCAHQMPPPQQQQHHPPPPPPQQLQRMPGPPAALLVAKQHRGDGGNVTPPNTLAMPNAPTSQTIFARQMAT
eukprot:COSAG02_NODE_8649_length_2491_cov_1.619565_2_plen_217_part_00